MKTGIILHSISDAEHCVENKLYEGNILFSTHASVDVYLKEKHNLDSQCLSRFISEEELIKERSAWLEIIGNSLKNLDSNLSPLLNDKFNLKLNYFTPLYFYFGGYQLLSYIWFVKCVRKIRDIFDLGKITFYDHRFSKYLNVSTTVNDLVPLFFEDIKADIIKIPEAQGTIRIKSKNIIDKLKRLKSCNLKFIYNKIIAVIRRCKFSKFSDNKKTILVSEPLYELESLIDHLHEYNILYYDSTKEGFPGFKKQRSIYNINSDSFDNFIKNEPNPFVKIFLKDIKEDFMSNISQYLSIIYLIEKINRKYPIALGLWGVSPAWKTKAMVFEYLRSNNIKIAGSQHGCLYGEVYSPWHFNIDLNRCNYFISWGFTKDDLERMYPSKKIELEILPFGKARIVKKEKAVKKIDLLFPITMSISMLDSGMDRVFPHIVAERQTIILEYLNLSGLSDIYIKPFMGSDEQNCSAWLTLKRLKNLKVIDKVVLTGFLEEYSPKAVLIDVPSQPLFDVLPLDTEIFLMSDPVNPYEERALEELKRRVHYCDTTDEVISKIGLFIKGGLEKKRDDTFYNHYMHKERTEENILGLVNGLLTKCRS